MPLTDARGQTIDLPHRPRRIISLVPSITELLADLGLAEEVVGLTRFCVHPEEWKRHKQIIGGTKNVNVGRVRDLAPDLILANLEENTRSDVEALDAIAPVYVTDVGDVPGALEMIRRVGAVTSRAIEAAKLAERIENAFLYVPDYPSLRAVYLIWRDPYMTVGGDTFIHDIMQRAGLSNAFGHVTRYPTLTADELVTARPDVVLLSTEPYPFKEAHFPELQRLLPKTTVCMVDGELFSWYGSRMLHTPSYLGRLRCTLEATGK